MKLLADLLGAKGYAVATAVNGEEALAKVAAENPDLILLDVMMPGLSGYDVCKRLRDEPGHCASADRPRDLARSAGRARQGHGSRRG